jgi:hypothetical protein
VSRAELNPIADIKRQLEMIPAAKRYLSWQFTYLTILEKRMREHGFLTWRRDKMRAAEAARIRI